MLGSRKENNGQDKAGGALRRLKLTPLEGLLGGLILVGLLYLFSVWAGFLGGGAPAAQQQQIAAPKGKVIRAIAASEKALARLDAFEADLNSMRSALDDAGISKRQDPGALLPGISKGSAPRPMDSDPKLTRKFIELENRVDTLVNSNPESDKALADRLGRLERQIEKSRLEDQKRIDKANQILTKLDDRIKNLNRMTQSGDDADQERFKELEKEVAALKKGGTKGQDADDKRLYQLEKRLTALDKALAGKDFSKQLAELDKQLKNKDKLAGQDTKALSQRLDKLTAAMEHLEKAAKDNDKTGQRLAGLEKQLASIEKSVLSKDDKKLSSIEKNIAFLAKAEKDDVKDLLSRLEALQKMVKQNPAGADEELAKRLSGLEAELAKLEKAAASGEPGSKPDTELVQRVESLETEVGWLKEDTSEKERSTAAKAEMEKRISRIETNVARLIRSLTRVQAPIPDAETLNRLTKLERQVAAADGGELGQRQKNLERRMDSLANLLANNLNSQGNTALYQRLTALENRLGTIAGTRQGPTIAAARATATPAKRFIYTVKAGDTLYRIAKKHAVTVEDIQRWNPHIGSGNKITIGQELVIVNGSTS